MGILSKLFKGGQAAPAPYCEPMTVYAPAEGEVIPLEQFPDEVFSQGVLGPGCGILPDGNLVVAPFNGTVVQEVDSQHAIGVASEDGVELLIHVGVDTVDMNGEGFRYRVSSGQRIRRGEPLIEFDRKAIQEAGHSDAIAVVVTNADDFAAVELQEAAAVSGETVMLKVKR